MLSTLLASGDGNAGGGAFQLVFFALIFVAMYFFLIRPQRRRMRETAALQSSLEEGDEVILASGIYGFISAMEGDTVWLDVADDVELRVTRSAIARKLTPSPASAPTDDDAAE